MRIDHSISIYILRNKRFDTRLFLHVFVHFQYVLRISQTVAIDICKQTDGKGNDSVRMLHDTCDRLMHGS